MGKNSIFSLRISIKVSEQYIIGIATGTAMTLKALPIPSPISIKVDKYFQKRLNQTPQKELVDIIELKSRINIELNFQMPIFMTIGSNRNHQLIQYIKKQ